MQELCDPAQVRVSIGCLFVDSGGVFDTDSGEPVSTEFFEQRVLIIKFLGVTEGAEGDKELQAAPESSGGLVVIA